MVWEYCSAICYIAVAVGIAALVMHRLARFASRPRPARRIIVSELLMLGAEEAPRTERPSLLRRIGGWGRRIFQSARMQMGRLGRRMLPLTAIGITIGGAIFLLVRFAARQIANPELPKFWDSASIALPPLQSAPEASGGGFASFLFWTLVLAVSVGILLTARLFPRWNNFILGGLALLTVVLFASAVVNGRPAGYQGLLSVTPKAIESVHTLERDRVLEHLRRAREADWEEHAQPAPAAKHATDGGQFPHWTLFFVSLALTTLYVPFAFWDEVRTVVNRISERLEQRPWRYRNHPPTPPNTPAPAAPPHRDEHGGGFWRRLWRWLPVELSSEMAENLIMTTLRRVVGGRK